MTKTISESLSTRLALLLCPTYRDTISDIGSQRGLTLDGAKHRIQANLDLKRDEGTNLWYYGAEKRTNSNWRYGLTRGHFEVFWPSGRLLAEIMAETSLTKLITDKNVLSVGAGSGLAEIYVVKKCRPRLMACFDTNIFARAAIELNAAANDVPVGDVLITISHPDLLGSISDGRMSYRLYDTVLTADCLHGKEGMRQREVKELVGVLTRLNRDGMDVIIADRNTAEGERKSGNLTRAKVYEAAQVTCGLTQECLVIQREIPIPRADLERIGVTFGDRANESVGLYHWPTQGVERPLPRFNVNWWHARA